jgi:phosphate/sulfate permease
MLGKIELTWIITLPFSGGLAAVLTVIILAVIKN